MTYMAYFIIAGILGLGFIAYRKRKSLIYNALKVYTDINDKLENQTELADNFKVKHFTLDKSDTTIRDHALSATPSEFKNLVKLGRLIKKNLNLGV